jgi:hypothetical protein
MRDMMGLLLCPAVTGLGAPCSGGLRELVTVLRVLWRLACQISRA